MIVTASSKLAAMEERLIEKVSEHEALYNTDSPGYRDQRARNTAWREVGHDMNMPASKCREIWAKLRNCYTNAIKRRLLIKHGQMPKKFPKWKYEDQMSFLVPHMVIKSNQESTSSDLSEATYDTGHDSSYLEEMSQPADDEESFHRLQQHGGGSGQHPGSGFELYPCSPASTLIGSSAGNTAGAKRKKLAGVELMTGDEMLQQLLEDKHRELDSTEMFYLSMARTVRRLPLVEQARIRLELCRLVSEAEIRCLGVTHQNQHHHVTAVSNVGQHVPQLQQTQTQQPDVQFNVKLK